MCRERRTASTCRNARYQPAYAKLEPGVLGSGGGGSETETPRSSSPAEMREERQDEEKQERRQSISILEEGLYIMEFQTFGPREEE